MGQMRDKKGLREEVVAAYLEGGWTYRELEYRYGVNKSTLQRWVKGVTETIATQKRVDEEKLISVRHAEAIAENKRLKEELRRAELHNKLLNSMIDIAEDRLGVDIRKKPGSKR
jgi:transposase-like protein